MPPLTTGDATTAAAWSALSAGTPDWTTLAAVEGTAPQCMAPAQLVDALKCCERLLSHVAGLQVTLLSEFARPGRSGDISRLVQATVDVGGLARESDGQVNTNVLSAIVTEHSHAMAAAELAASLDIAPVTARHRVESAVDLHDRLPQTHRALTDGEVDRSRAALIAECTSTLEYELCLEVEKRVLTLVPGRTAGRLRPLIERAVLIADPDTTRKRIEKAKREREVTHRPIKDQMSLIKAVLPAEGAVSVFTLIDLIAASTAGSGDDRSVAERRADALTDVATQLLTDGHLDLRGLLPAATVVAHRDRDVSAERTGEGETADGRQPTEREAPPAEEHGFDPPHVPTAPDDVGNPTVAPLASDPSGPTDCADPAEHNGTARTSNAGPAPAQQLTRQGRRPHLTVTMSLSTLMALDQLPAHLEGYGAITAELATAVAAAAASVSIAVIDPHTGTPQHASGRFGYRPSQKQRDVVTTLAATCRFPSCRQPAWRCDLDHRTAYDHQSPQNGGPTCPCNLDPHCRRHHLLKHHSDWSARRGSDGSMMWSSPTGHRYTDAPTELTLPDELLTRTDGPRLTLGAADVEHLAQCGRPLTREQPTPSAVEIHLAQRRAFRERVLGRIRSAQRAGLLGGKRDRAVKEQPASSKPPDAAFIRDVIANSFRQSQAEPTALEIVQRRLREARAGMGPQDDSNPPF